MPTPPKGGPCPTASPGSCSWHMWAHWVVLWCIRTDQRAPATTFCPQASCVAAIVDSVNYHVGLDSRKLHGEGATPALLGLPGAKLICNAKQHQEHTLSALQACANSPGNGKWQRLMFWCCCFKGSTENRRFPFFHIPSHGTEVNEVRERSPFLNICFLVCKLFRMPMPAGYRGILVRELPCSKF